MMEPTFTFGWLNSDLQINMTVVSTVGILGLVWALLEKDFRKLLMVLAVFAGIGTAGIIILGLLMRVAPTVFIYSILSYVVSTVFSGWIGFVIGEFAMWIGER